MQSFVFPTYFFFKFMEEKLLAVRANPPPPPPLIKEGLTMSAVNPIYEKRNARFRKIKVGIRFSVDALFIFV